MALVRSFHDAAPPLLCVCVVMVVMVVMALANNESAQQ